MTMDKHFIWRGAPVNVDLASRYEGQWHDSVMEHHVKCDAATAAKTATQLKRMAELFGPVLDASQLLALRAAAQVSARLASDLKILRPWAAAYSKFCAEKRRRQHEERLDLRAAQLWVSDEEAFAEAADLVAFYAGSTAGVEVEAFISEQRGHKSVYRGTSGAGVRDAISLLPGLLSSRRAQEVRRCAVQILDEMSEGMSGWNGTWIAGREDYLAWRQAHAKGHAIKSAALVSARG